MADGGVTSMIMLVTALIISTAVSALLIGSWTDAALSRLVHASQFLLQLQVYRA